MHWVLSLIRGPQEVLQEGVILERHTYVDRVVHAYLVYVSQQHVVRALGNVGQRTRLSSGSREMASASVPRRCRRRRACCLASARVLCCKNAFPASRTKRWIGMAHG